MVTCNIKVNKHTVKKMQSQCQELICCVDVSFILDNLQALTISDTKLRVLGDKEKAQDNNKYLHEISMQNKT